MKDLEEREEEISSVPVFGFIGWLTSAVAYVLYLVWAFTPNQVLESHGITYYPSKYWAIAIPAWVSVTIVAAYWMYESSNLMIAPSNKWYLEQDDGGGPLHDEEEDSINEDEEEDFDDAKGRQFGSNGRDTSSPVYFSSKDSEGILPVIEIPCEIIKMMASERMTAKEALEKYQERRANRRNKRK